MQAAGPHPALGPATPHPLGTHPRQRNRHPQKMNTRSFKWLRPQQPQIPEMANLASGVETRRVLDSGPVVEGAGCRAENLGAREPV